MHINRGDLESSIPHQSEPRARLVQAVRPSWHEEPPRIAQAVVRARRDLEQPDVVEEATAWVAGLRYVFQREALLADTQKELASAFGLVENLRDVEVALYQRLAKLLNQKGGW